MQAHFDALAHSLIGGDCADLGARPFDMFPQTAEIEVVAELGSR